MSDTQFWLIAISTMFRVFAFILGIVAVSDVITSGLIVKNVPWWAKGLLYVTLLALGASSMAGIYRIKGEAWAPVFRESAHIAVSVAWCTVFTMVLAADTIESDGRKVNGYQRFLNRIKHAHLLQK